MTHFTTIQQLITSVDSACDDSRDGILTDNIHSWTFDPTLTDFSSLFSVNRHSSCIHFNQDISNWDVSNVEKFNAMFYGVTSFKQLLNWDISSATTCQLMFYNVFDPTSPEDQCMMQYIYTQFNTDAFIYTHNWGGITCQLSPLPPPQAARLSPPPPPPPSFPPPLSPPLLSPDLQTDFPVVIVISMVFGLLNMLLTICLVCRNRFRKNTNKFESVGRVTNRIVQGSTLSVYMP